MTLQMGEQKHPLFLLLRIRKSEQYYEKSEKSEQYYVVSYEEQKASLIATE